MFAVFGGAKRSYISDLRTSRTGSAK